MRTSLLAAFSRVVLFWWLSYLIFWGWGKPENVEIALARLSWLREVFGFDPIVQGDVTVLNDVVALGALLAGWTLPVTATAALFIGVGIAFAHTAVSSKLKERDARVARSASWRAVNVTKGPLPLPPAGKLPVPVEPLPLAIDPPAPYGDFLREALAHLKGATKAYTGEGPNKESLHAQAIASVEKGVRAKASPMVLCLLVARYLGNLGAYAKSEGTGEWLRIKSPEIEASRRTAMLAGWWAMTDVERTGLALALRYFDAPDYLPTPGACPDAKEFAERLIMGAKSIDAAIAALEEAEALARKAQAEAAALALATQVEAPARAAVSDAASAVLDERSTAEPTHEVARGSLNSVAEVATGRGVASLKRAQERSEAPKAPKNEGASPNKEASGVAGVEARQLPSVSPAPIPAPVPAPAVTSAPVAAQALPLLEHDVEATPESIALQLLLDKMHTLQFQVPGLTKGQRAAGAKRGSRIYLFDAQVRVSLLGNATPEVKALFKEDGERTKGQLFPFTKALCRALLEKGWLVLKVGDMVVSRKTPLWRIRSGTTELAGVLIIDIPEEFKSRLPSSDTTYEIKVLGPQFDEREFIGSDVMGALLAFNDSGDSK